jgi:hypothetical protein
MRGETMVIARLHDMLSEVRRRTDAAFSGVGVIVSSDPSCLPILSLTPARAIAPGVAAVDLLTEVSSLASPYHDGFHVLSPTLDVILLSQFFAPIIRPGASLDRRVGAGARYAAAMLGSSMPGVIATGLATSANGVAVFHDGVLVERRA